MSESPEAEQAEKPIEQKWYQRKPFLIGASAVAAVAMVTAIAIPMTVNASAEENVAAERVLGYMEAASSISTLDAEIKQATCEAEQNSIEAGTLFLKADEVLDSEIIKKDAQLLPKGVRTPLADAVADARANLDDLEMTDAQREAVFEAENVEAAECATAPDHPRSTPDQVSAEELEAILKEVDTKQSELESIRPEGISLAQITPIIESLNGPLSAAVEDRKSFKEVKKSIKLASKSTMDKVLKMDKRISEVASGIEGEPTSQQTLSLLNGLTQEAKLVDKAYSEHKEAKKKAEEQGIDPNSITNVTQDQNGDYTFQTPPGTSNPDNPSYDDPYNPPYNPPPGNNPPGNHNPPPPPPPEDPPFTCPVPGPGQEYGTSWYEINGVMCQRVIDRGSGGEDDW